MIQIHPKVSGLLADGDVPGLREALQSAIELEHAVIPPYLYALYSLVPGGNRAAAGILRSVIVEEMLHLTLAANLLNAVGGRPTLDSPGMLPRYPGPLPGTVDDGLIVGLAPFSVPLVRDVFMAIEQPEPDNGDPSGEPLTIGQFYRRIRAIVTTLGDGAFTGPASRQVTTDLLPGAIGVTGVASACQAIDTIIDQGEGTMSSPLEVVGTDVAHYYRFAEIVHGRKLIRFPGPHRAAGNEGGRWAYLGEPVTVNPAGIHDVPVNPTLDGYPADSPAQHACRSFNATYTNLLRALHTAFNGDPRHLMTVLDIMSSLKQQAQDMMASVSTTGIPAGPSFEWQPTD